MGKIITFSNQKGGIGKTTSTINVAASVALLGKKVLICDIDPQGNATSGVGINKRGDGNTLYEALIGKCEPHEAIVKTEFENLYCIPANIALAGAEFEFIDIEDRELRLKGVLDALRDDFDYIFIDSPPSLGILTINALSASDGVVIPMTCEYYSLEGLSQLMISVRQTKMYFNKSLEIVGILITMFDKRLRLTRDVLAEVRKYYKDKVFNTKITRSVALAEAPSRGMPIVYYDRSSKGAIAYRNVADELIKRI